MTEDDTLLSGLPSNLWLDNPFWQFSLQLWQNPDAQKALLALQDNQQWVINQLLFACWSGMQKIETRQLNDDLLALAANWQKNWVDPLRQQRKALRSQITWQQQLKQPLQAAELACEQVAQALLFYAFEQSQAPLSKKSNSLEIVCMNLLQCSKGGLMSEQQNQASLAQLAQLLKALVPNHTDERIDDYLKAALSAMTGSKLT